MAESHPMKVTPVVLDRTINLPFLMTVAAALIAGLMWTSTVNSRLDRVEERTSGLPELTERIARMDERGQNTRDAIARIERQLEREQPARR